MPELRIRDAGRGGVLPDLRHGARSRRATPGRAEVRLGAVRRHGRVHGPVGSSRSRGRPRHAPGVPLSRQAGDRALRGHRREVHRRRGHGRLRRAGRARRRRGARGPRGTPRRRRGRGAEPRATRRPDRGARGGQHGRGRDRHRIPTGDGRGARAGRRREHRLSAADLCAGRRAGRRRGDVPRDATRDPLPRARARPGQGQARPARGVARDRADRRARRAAGDDGAAGRPRPRAGPAGFDLGARRGRAPAPPGHGRRTDRHRQVADHRGDRRTDRGRGWPRDPGPMPAVRPDGLPRLHRTGARSGGDLRIGRRRTRRRGSWARDSAS